jgi:alpha-1,2-mannosyltransferase
VLGLRHVELIAPEAYPRFTLIRQAWGSLLLGLEALRLMVPEVRQSFIQQLRGY